MPSSLAARLELEASRQDQDAPSLPPADGGRGRGRRPRSRAADSRPKSSLALAATAASSRASASASLGRSATYDVSDRRRAPPMETEKTAQRIDEKGGPLRRLGDNGSPASTSVAASEQRRNHVAVDDGRVGSDAPVTPSPFPPPPETAIQSLLRRLRDPPPLPPPYCMCSKSEAYDRQKCSELSLFEILPKSLKVNASSREAGLCRRSRDPPAQHHPRLVVKKYRRSAAGGGTLSRESRTVDQLKRTVDYLLGRVFAEQKTPVITEENDETARNTTAPPSGHRGSLCETVAFIDDRLRAVQKDLVTLLGRLRDDNPDSAQHARHASRAVYSASARYNILALYLLSDAPPSRYEARFGARALRASLTSYLDLSDWIDEDYDCTIATSQELGTHDEMMAYAALLHISGVMRVGEESMLPPTSGDVAAAIMEDGGTGMGALQLMIHSGCRLRGAATTSPQWSLEKLPRWKWALDLACVAQEGNYRRYFSLLKAGPEKMKLSVADNVRFLILARCCASRSLNLARLGQVRCYNRSFGKGERVHFADLGRLLHASEEQAALLCCDAGLPVSIEGHPGAASYVTMKSAPVKVSGGDAARRMGGTRRVEDGFVFGSNVAAAGLTQKTGIVELNGESSETDAWIDQDGVLIPSSEVIRSLLMD